MKQTHAHKAPYRREIDGLRALAVLSVVAFHGFPGWLDGGFIGVDIFFVISGFLITYQLLEKLEHGQFSFADFFGRRIRRIFPALALVMGSVLAFGYLILYSDEYAQLGRHVASGSAFILNFVLAHETGYFNNAALRQPMLHVWSLAVEEQFYIIWPVILWAAWKRHFSLLMVIVLVAVLSFSFNIGFSALSTKPEDIFFWPFGRFWELLSGGILAWITLYKKEILSNGMGWLDTCLIRTFPSQDRGADGSGAADVIALTGFSLLIYGVIRINEYLVFPSYWALIPVLGTVLIIIAGSQSRINRALLMNPAAVWLGLISYPLYLWHWPILSFLYIIEGKKPPPEAGIIAVLVSVLLAWATYRFLEIPIRTGRVSHQKTICLLAILAAVGVSGFVVQQTGGRTPFNAEADHIRMAKNGVPSSERLIENHAFDHEFLTTSDAPPEILFLGDSQMGNYHPRVIDLYKKGLIKEAGFFTQGGCPPIPHFVPKHPKRKKCASRLKTLEDILAAYPTIHTIIISTLFNRHFFRSHRFFDVVDDENRIIHGEKEKVAQAKASFYGFVGELSQKYRVIVLGNIPTGRRFSPDGITNVNQGRTIPLKVKITADAFRPDKKHTRLEKEMAARLSDLDVIFIPQSDKICPDGICYPLTDDGKPKYRDGGHMRPFFVKEYMDVFDEFILSGK